MKHESKQTRFDWFLPFRLASFVILFASVVFWLDYPSYLREVLITYSAFTLVFALLLAFGFSEKYRTSFSIIVAVHFLLEIVLESGVIYATGNVSSPYTGLFVLTIVSAALYYRLTGTLIWASIVALGYSFVVWLGITPTDGSLFSVEAVESIFSTREDLFYSIFLHILIFYLVSFISGYLAQRLTDRDRELKAASVALQMARLETDDILLHLNSGLLTINAQGRIIFFNRAAERILGYAEETVKGLHCSDVFGERMPELATKLTDGLEGRTEYPRYEISITSSDSLLTPIGMSTSVLTDAVGDIRGIIAIFSDLTEAKRLERKVRAADRLAAIGELSASIAHEIRNPLAAISGSVEVLAAELAPTGDNRRLMSLIVKESERLSKILDEFLSYARIDRPAYSKVELCHIIGEVIELMYHHKSYHPGIKVSLESSESIVYVVGDEDLLKQMLLNFALNSCEALGTAPGEIVFQLLADPNGQTLNLLIRDTGSGIPPDQLSRIYEPFHSTKKGGTGLGLAIVHRICQALNLSLSVESTPGIGTTFQLTLKLFDKPAPDRSIDLQTVGTKVNGASAESSLS